MDAHQYLLSRIINAVPTQKNFGTHTDFSAISRLFLTTWELSDLIVGDMTGNARVEVMKNTASVGTRRAINLIEGTNITLTVTDDSVNERVDVTIDASGGGGGGAPTTSHYVTTQADAGLSNEHVLGSSVIMYGTLAARPASAIAGLLYYVTDAGAQRLTRDNGVTWDNLDPGWATLLSKVVVNADVDAAAAIVESKLALNFATHSNANDPTANEKAALAGTSGAPAVGNKYVTDADARNTNSRTPTAHASTHASVGSDPITITEAQVTNLVADLATLTSGVAASALATRNINTTAPISGGGNLTADRTISLNDDGVTFAKMQNIATDRLIGRDTAATGDPEELTVGGGLEFTGAGGVQRSALTGNVTAPAGSNVTTIPATTVTSSMLRDSAALSLIGRPLNSVGVPSDIVAANDGEVLQRAGTTLAFAQVDTLSIRDAAVTYTKMQNISEISKLLGRGAGSGVGPPVEITLGTNLSMAGTTLNATSGSSGALPLAQHVLAADFTITDGNSAVVSRYLEIGAGFTLTIGVDSDLEIT